MIDLKIWDDAVAAVRKEYETLSTSEKIELGLIFRSIRREKREISSIMENSAVPAACERCAGECCKSGKYHFTAIDLLIFIDGGSDLFHPSFREGHCPYVGRCGCLMEPQVRPFTCITFFCENAESLLNRGEAARLREIEVSLRNLYNQVERFFGMKLMQGLLLNYERVLNGESMGILLKKQVK